MERLSAFSFCVDKTDEGKRLDLFLSEKIDNVSRSYASQLVKNRHIRVNGQFKKPAYQLKFPDKISGALPHESISSFLPEPMDLSVIFEDKQIIVIDKPPGLVVHPAPGHYSGTLVNGLLHHCPDIEGISGEIRPGIVHRLDKDTSGVIVVAKNAHALEHLARQFKLREVKKEYTALILGELKTNSGFMDMPIGRHPVHRKKMSTKSRRARSAETHWKIIMRFPGVCLVEIELKTGRTHQIRVHFSTAGHPIVGDPVYGGNRKHHQVPENIRNIIVICKTADASCYPTHD